MALFCVNRLTGQGGSTDITIHIRWEFPSSTGLWEQSMSFGVGGGTVGFLDADGRQVLLNKFGLESCADELPLMLVSSMSPRKLAKRRRELEMQQGLERLEIACDLDRRLADTFPDAN